MDGIGRAAAALVVLAALTAVVFAVVVTALVRLGMPEWAASPTAIGATVAAALAAADVFGPFGNRERAETLRAVSRQKLGVDVALAAAVGGVLGFLGAQVLLSGNGSGLAELVVISTAVLVGYATFVSRNLAVYSGEPR